MADKIEVQNVGHAGKTYRVDAAKYAEMRRHMLAVLPDTTPGMKVADLAAAVRPLLSGDLFPNGETCGWRVKCGQFDLEAKGILARTPAPVRLWRVQ